MYSLIPRAGQSYDIQIWHIFRLLNKASRESHAVLLWKHLNLESQEGRITMTEISMIFRTDLTFILYSTCSINSEMDCASCLHFLLNTISPFFFFWVSRKFQLNSIVACMMVHWTPNRQKIIKFLLVDVTKNSLTFTCASFKEIN